MDNETREALRDLTDQLDGLAKTLRAIVDGGDAPPRCGCIRSGRAATFPCVRDAGHYGMHADSDGDTF